MPVLARTKVDRQYRTTVPREVRRILEVGRGDEVEWLLEDGMVVVRKRGGS